MGKASWCEDRLHYSSPSVSFSRKRTRARTNSNKRTEKNDETEGNLSSGQDSPANPLILTSSVIQLQSINVLEVRHSHFNGQTPLWISQIDVKEICNIIEALVSGRNIFGRQNTSDSEGYEAFGHFWGFILESISWNFKWGWFSLHIALWISLNAFAGPEIKTWCVLCHVSFSATNGIYYIRIWQTPLIERKCI